VAATPPVAGEAPGTITEVAERLKERFFQREVPFGGIIQQRYGSRTPPELSVAAVIHTESSFVPTVF